MHLKTRPRRHLTTITRRFVWVCACVCLLEGVGVAHPLQTVIRTRKDLLKPQEVAPFRCALERVLNLSARFSYWTWFESFAPEANHPHTHSRRNAGLLQNGCQVANHSNASAAAACVRLNEWAWVCACVGAQLSCSLVRVVVCSLAPTLCRFWLCLSIVSLSTYLFVLDIYYCKVLKSYTSKACYNCRSSMRSDDPISSGAWVQIFAHLTL